MSWRSETENVHQSINLSIYLSMYLSIYLSTYPSIYLSIYPSIYLSIYISIYYSSIYFTPEVSPLELEMGICKISHKKSPLGRKSKLLSIYRVGLAICIEMVGPVCQCCHFPCLGSLPSPTLSANGAVAGELSNFTMFFSDLFWIFPWQLHGPAVARPSCRAGDRSICHNMNVLLCETERERERERETAGRRRSITVYAFFSWAKEIIIFNPSGALTILGLLRNKYPLVFAVSILQLKWFILDFFHALFSKLHFKISKLLMIRWFLIVYLKWKAQHHLQLEQQFK